MRTANDMNVGDAQIEAIPSSDLNLQVQRVYEGRSMKMLTLCPLGFAT